MFVLGLGVINKKKYISIYTTNAYFGLDNPECECLYTVTLKVIEQINWYTQDIYTKQNYYKKRKEKYFLFLKPRPPRAHCCQI
jgi:hypothetical protein